MDRFMAAFSVADSKKEYHKTTYRFYQAPHNPLSISAQEQSSRLPQIAIACARERE